MKTSIKIIVLICLLLAYHRDVDAQSANLGQQMKSFTYETLYRYPSLCKESNVKSQKENVSPKESNVNSTKENVVVQTNVTVVPIVEEKIEFNNLSLSTISSINDYLAILKSQSWEHSILCSAYKHAMRQLDQLEDTQQAENIVKEINQVLDGVINNRLSKKQVESIIRDEANKQNLSEYKIFLTIRNQLLN